MENLTTIKLGDEACYYIGVMGASIHGKDEHYVVIVSGNPGEKPKSVCPFKPFYAIKLGFRIFSIGLWYWLTKK